MKCIKCGNEYPSSYYFEVQGVCKECFGKLPEEEKKELLDLEVYYHPVEYSAYPGRVGFGLRFAAQLIDFVFLSIVMFIAIVYTGSIDPLLELFEGIGFLNGIQDPELMKEFEFLTEELSMSIGLLSVFIHLLYRITEVLFAATPGKILFGIRITNSDGTRADYTALGKRFLLKQSDVLLSLIGLVISISIFEISSMIAWLIVVVGYFFVLNDKKQAFHDMYANTAVFKKEDIKENESDPK